MPGGVASRAASTPALLPCTVCPSPLPSAAEALWLTALEEARRRAQLESGSTRRALARERQDLAVEAHVISIREQELKDRLAEADRRAAKLELEIETLTTLLRKEQASRAAADRRLAEHQVEIRKALASRAPRRARGAVGKVQSEIAQTRHKGGSRTRRYQAQAAEQ